MSATKAIRHRSPEERVRELNRRITRLEFALELLYQLHSCATVEESCAICCMRHTMERR